MKSVEDELREIAERQRGTALESLLPRRCASCAQSLSRPDQCPGPSPV